MPTAPWCGPRTGVRSGGPGPAGARTRPLTAVLESVDPSRLDDESGYDNRRIGLRSGVGAADLRRAVHAAGEVLGGDLSTVPPFVTEKALRELKFADLLPPDLACATLEARLADPDSVSAVVRMSIVGGLSREEILAHRDGDRR